MIHGKIDTEDLTFEVVMADVEELNAKAFKSELDITKLSYHAYAYLTKEYILLNTGSALGYNAGPLLITKNLNAKIESVAIPGKYTTANFLLSLAKPELKNKTEMLFSDIEEAVLKGKVDAGLIIHESRFTYEQKGLKKVIDLGEYWQSLVNAPIPLGGIVVKRNISENIQQKIDRVLKRSIEFAFTNPLSSLEFVKQHSQEMSEEVMQKHIDLYVNKYSVDLGKEGKQAIQTMFEKAVEIGLIDKIEEGIFVKN
jgi:1,4-dihydroxy-6-naphthoate synthase